MQEEEALEEADAPEPRTPQYACEVDENGLLGVPPEIWESVKVFEACWHQWNVIVLPGAMGAAGGIWYDGLDHSKVHDTMAMMKVRNTHQVLEDLRLMEAVARVERNRRANGK